MQLHPNAKLTPAQRKLLVRRIRKEDWTVTEAAEAAGVSRPTAYKWLRRYDAEGPSGLEDRSSRPLPGADYRRAGRFVDPVQPGDDSL